MFGHLTRHSGFVPQRTAFGRRQGSVIYATDQVCCPVKIQDVGAISE